MKIKNYVLVLALLFAGIVSAQMSGSYTIPGSFSSLGAAIASLNAVGVSGPVTIDINAGYTETVTAGGYTIGAITGASASNSIVIQKSGTGSNPLFTAFVGTATPASAIQDGVISLIGTDYLTISGIQIYDPNTSNPATMEYGIGMFRASATDGCQNNTIIGCVINLNRINNAAGSGPSVEGSRGISAVNALFTTQTTGLTVTSFAGTNSNNKFYNNLIVNCNVGIALMGFAAATPFTAADAGNDIGGLSAATGNTIVNFGGGGTTSAASGIRTLAQYTFNVSYNNIDNNDGVTFGGGINHAAALAGINIGAATSATLTVSNNTVSLKSAGTTAAMQAILNAAGSTAASNLVTISNNLITACAYTTATSAVFNGIINSSTAATLAITSNTITNLNYSGTGTGVLIETGSPISCVTNSNVITNINRTGASGSFRLIKTTSPTNLLVSNNFVSNVQWSNLSSSGSIDGFYSLSSAVGVTVTNNTFQNFATPNGGTLNGIREFGVSGNKLITNNVVNNFSTTAGGGGGTNFNGIFCSTGSIYCMSNVITNLNNSGGTGGTTNGINLSGGTQSSLSKNRIGSFSSTSTGAIIQGIYISGCTTNSIVNNVIGNFNTPSTTQSGGQSGIYTNGGSTHYIYNNSIYLSGSSAGAGFGSSGILNSTAQTVDLRNNVIVNNCVPNGTGISAAYRRTSATISSYSSTSNNNLFYAGNPSASNLIYSDGVNAFQNLIAFQLFASGRDVLSVTENPTFVSTLATSASFLNVNTSVATQIEGGAQPIASVTDDIAGTVRNAATPDMGAWEGNFLSPACTSVPASNTAVATVTNICSGGGSVLYLASTYTDTGLSYSWQTSTVGASGPFTAVSGATNAISSVSSLTANTWVQAVISCINTGGSYTTSPVQISVGAPVVTASASSPSVCIGSNSAVFLSANTTSLTYQWLSSTTGSTGPFAPVAGGTSFSLAVTNVTNSTYFQAVVSCSADPTASIITNVVSTNTVFSVGQCGTYCTASVTSTADDEIFNVSIGTLNNTSTCGQLAGGPGSVPYQYSNYCGVATTPSLNAATNYTLAVTVGMCGTSSYSGIVTAYIDYNQNNSFTDPGELVYTSPYQLFAIGGTQVSTVITIPALATPGITRMRIIEVESSTAAGPCSTTNSWGEVEDYLVNIIPPPPCSGTPVAATVVANPTIVCSGGSSNLSLSTSYTNSGISYAWESASSASGPFVAIPSATNAIYTATNLTTPTWFQAIVTCVPSNNSITAASASVGILGAPIYASIPFLENFDNTWQDRCATRNVPVTSFWSSNPVVGNNSWRRQNDGGSASWTSGTGTVAPLAGGGCANFHTYDAASGTSGEMLLYVNLNSPSPTYSLSFYYFNSTGSDSLEVLLSTNGGGSFTKIGGYKTASAWTKQIINLGAISSPSCVISFSATSDYGLNDIGIDSLEIKTCPQLVVAQTPSAVCPGGSATLTVSGANNYVWSNASTASAIAITPTANTIYTVTGSNGACAVSTTVSSNVRALPTINISGSSGICTGQSATLVASGASTYTWDNGATTNSIVTTPTTNVTYTVVGTDGFGCVNTNTQAITVAASLSITIAGPNTVCIGSAPTLTAQGGVTYLWSNGATTATIAPVISANTSYSVIGSSGTCSNTASLAITAVALPTVSISGNTLICAGQSTSLTASGATTYSWSTSSTNTTIAVSPSVNTTYTVTGFSLGCGSQTTIAVTSNTVPVITISAASSSVCISTVANFTANGAATYTWVNGPQTNTASFTATSAAVYTVSGTNAANCVSTKTVSMGVYQLPSVVIAPASATACSGVNVTFTASGASTYTWNGTPTATGNIYSNASLVSTIYSVQATSAQGCLNSQTVALTANPLPTISISPASATVCSQSPTVFVASGANFYSWNVGGNTASLTVAPVNSTVYTATGTDANGCVGTKTVAVTTLSLPVIVITPSFATICTASTASFSATGANTYTWSNAANTATTAFTPTVSSQYFVSGTNPEGCVGNTPLTVITIPLPVINVTKPSNTVCANAAGNYTASGANTYTWSTTATGSVSAITPTANSVYSVIGTDTITGCVNTKTFAVNTYSAPVITILPAASQSVCNNIAVNYTVSGANTFTWSTGVFGPVLALTPTSSAVYTVTGKNQQNCITSKTISVVVYSIAVVNASAMDDTLCSKETTTLSANGAVSYTWLPYNANGQTYTVSPVATLQYTVVGTDANGCEGKDSVRVIVEKCTGIESFNSLSTMIKLYPNPSNGQFTIELPFDGTKTIKVYSISGALISVTNTTEQIQQMNLSDRAKGIYYLQIESSGKSANFKVGVE